MAENTKQGEYGSDLPLEQRVGNFRQHVLRELGKEIEVEGHQAFAGIILAEGVSVILTKDSQNNLFAFKCKDAIQFNALMMNVGPDQMMDLTDFKESDVYLREVELFTEKKVGTFDRFGKSEKEMTVQTKDMRGPLGREFHEDSVSVFALHDLFVGPQPDGEDHANFFVMNPRRQDSIAGFSIYDKKYPNQITLNFFKPTLVLNENGRSEFSSEQGVLDFTEKAYDFLSSINSPRVREARRVVEEVTGFGESRIVFETPSEHSADQAIFNNLLLNCWKNAALVHAWWVDKETVGKGRLVDDVSMVEILPFLERKFANLWGVIKSKKDLGIDHWKALLMQNGYQFRGIEVEMVEKQEVMSFPGQTQVVAVTREELPNRVTDEDRSKFVINTWQGLKGVGDDSGGFEIIGVRTSDDSLKAVEEAQIKTKKEGKSDRRNTPLRELKRLKHDDIYLRIGEGYDQFYRHAHPNVREFIANFEMDPREFKIEELTHWENSELARYTWEELGGIVIMFQGLNPKDAGEELARVHLQRILNLHNVVRELFTRMARDRSKVLDVISYRPSSRSEIPSFDQIVGGFTVDTVSAINVICNKAWEGDPSHIIAREAFEYLNNVMKVRAAEVNLSSWKGQDLSVLALLEYPSIRSDAAPEALEIGRNAKSLVRKQLKDNGLADVEGLWLMDSLAKTMYLGASLYELAKGFDRRSDWAVEDAIVTLDHRLKNLIVLDIMSKYLTTGL
jgi:hypothetical protein